MKFFLVRVAGKSAPHVTGLLCILLAACNDSGSDHGAIAPVTIGGVVYGLTGSGLVLQDNGGDNLPIAKDGAFVFNTSLYPTSQYAITVLTQPALPGQVCSVSPASGTVGTTNVNTVSVVCRTIGQFAYTANNGSGNVSGFAIDPGTGALTPIAGNPVAVGSGPAQVTLTSDGKFAYVAIQSGKQIAGFAIDPQSGALTPVPGSPFTTPFVKGQPFPGASIEPLNRFLYIASLNDAQIAGFAIDATTGALAPVPGSPYAAGSNSSGLPAFSPNGYFVYVTNQGSVGGVSGFSIDQVTGALIPIPGSPFPTGNTPTWMSFVPSGRFAYVSNTGANSISAYAADIVTGELTQLPGSPFSDGTRHPVDLTIDSAGGHLYVPNRDSNNISVYGIDPNSGALTTVTGSPFAAGAGPALVGIEPTGRFAYVASGAGNDVHGYSIDQGTGALTALPGSPYAAGSNPLFVTVDPSGKYAYTANQQSADISAYSLDGATGALTPVPGGPFATGIDPFTVSISPEAP
ncbi:MAG TPA: beta-propeller fold lactonase family protein, partial [Steroidobacteraceae bacterium]